METSVWVRGMWEVAMFDRAWGLMSPSGTLEKEKRAAHRPFSSFFFLWGGGGGEGGVP